MSGYLGDSSVIAGLLFDSLEGLLSVIRVEVWYRAGNWDFGAWVCWVGVVLMVDGFCDALYFCRFKRCWDM